MALQLRTLFSSAFLKIWWISLFIKLFLSASFPLSFDEAYYWIWSHHMQLSYFDHPPFVAWLFYLGHFLEPFYHAVRWPAVILGHCTFLIWFALLKSFLSDEKISFWFILCLFNPMLGLGSLIITPDLPLLFFWAAALYFFKRCLEDGRFGHFIGFGMSLGLGFTAKYHIVLFIFFAGLFALLYRPKAAFQLKSLLACLIAFIFCASPVWLWNLQNDFQSFTFQLRHGFTNRHWSFVWFIEYLAGQIFVLFPPLLFMVLKFKENWQLRGLSMKKSSEHANFSTALKFLAWGPLLFFAVSSLRSPVEMNWPVVSYAIIFLMFVTSTFNYMWYRRALMYWFSLTLILIGLLNFVKSGPLYQKITEPIHFKPYQSLVDEYKPLYAGSYQMASSLSYLSKQPVYKLRDMSRYDFFDSLNESLPTQSPFYLLKEIDASLPDWINTAKYQVKEVKHLDSRYQLLEIRF